MNPWEGEGGQITAFGEMRANQLSFKMHFPLLQFGVAVNAKYRRYGEAHPCTGTDALYRPYGP